MWPGPPEPLFVKINGPVAAGGVRKAAFEADRAHAAAVERAAAGADANRIREFEAVEAGGVDELHGATVQGDRAVAHGRQDRAAALTAVTVSGTWDCVLGRRRPWARRLSVAGSI